MRTELDSNFVLIRAQAGASRTLIVFVHGLGGSEDTWAKFPELAIDGLGGASKDSAIFRYYKGAKSLLRRRPSPQVRSRQLANHLTQVANDYQEIYLVGHSLGGLIAEDAVRRFHQQKKGSYPEVGIIAGVIVFGSPRLGSKWVRSWSAIALRESFYLRRHSGIQGDIEEFFSNHVNVDIDVAPSNGKVQIPRFVCAGTKDRMVDELSATFGVREAQIKLLDCGHKKLVKPETADSPSAAWLGGVIREISSRRQEWYASLAEKANKPPMASQNLPGPLVLVTEVNSDIDLTDWVDVYNEVRNRLTTEAVVFVDRIAAPAGMDASILVAIQRPDRLVNDIYQPTPLLQRLDQRFRTRTVSLMVAAPNTPAVQKLAAVKEILHDAASDGSAHRLAVKEFSDVESFGDGLLRWFTGIVAADPRRRQLIYANSEGRDRL
ncbi:hypothetical protein GCM10009773_03370 [Williamsia serinedens]